MAKVNINGEQAKDMLVNFIKVSNMEKENGKVLDKQPIATCTREFTLMIKSMDPVFLHGQVETFIKEITVMMKDMVMDKCSGQMEACMRENGVEVFSMV